MGFTYYHLSEPDVRQTMVDAWQAEWDDLAANWPRGKCYGKQLTDDGWKVFKKAMPEALARQDDDWLLQEMRLDRFWVPTLARRTKSGTTMVKYSKLDALEKLVSGEFNIAYIHGLAQALIARGQANCTVYRADQAYLPRGECSTWEGRQFALADVIAGHRVRYHPPPGQRQAWSVPSGPNCHHSIRAS